MSVGACTVSASVKMSVEPLAAAAPCAHAHCFPNHPSGTGAPSITLARGSSAAIARTIAPVPSSERSSTTISSMFGHRVRRIERTHRSMLCASLRAGTITDTSAASLGASSSASSLSDGESRPRHSNTSGPSTHGSDAIIQETFTRTS